MSAQFGKCNFDGEQIAPQDIEAVRTLLAPYGPDREGYFCRDDVGILYRALDTTKESRSEVQPHPSASGLIVTWDGRLDNREELTNEIGCDLSAKSTDVAIAAAAYDKWQTGAFAKLMGDWAVSIWDPKQRSLILAKDFLGTRPLYYFVEKDHVSWCTILDPLVLFAGRSLELEEEYIAGCLSFFPAPHLTPYAGVRSVPPSCFVRLAKDNQTVAQHWDFVPARKIRYRRDAEYEEHFRIAFADSVRRRLRSDMPVLAELSGGMDSSSIVCMAALLLNEGTASAPRLDTLSYYSDGEPNWDERPYFARVEEKLGRVGCHIDVSAEVPALFSDSESFAVTPGSFREQSDARRQFASFLRNRGNVVILSGTGGDEVLGGVPAPAPLLADLIATANIRSLITQLTAWSMANRKPAIQLLKQAISAFLPLSLAWIAPERRPVPWLRTDFAKRDRVALLGYPEPLRFSGSLPSFQDNMSTLRGLRRQLGCSTLPSQPPYDKRYPFLDRTLLEFLYAIPQDQILRPGHRRSLMRRALRGIVPDEILNRKRKAFVARKPLRSIAAQRNLLFEITKEMMCDIAGIVDPEQFRLVISRALCGLDVPLVPLLRTIGIERWLRNVNRFQSRGSAVAGCNSHKPAVLRGGPTLAESRTEATSS